MSSHNQFDPSHRLTYSPSQLHRYYDRISLPASLRAHPVTKDPAAAQTSAGLDFLTALQRHQLASIPFENLELHYSSHHTISLDPQHLFDKIVDRGTGRGGYCMENSALFGTVLRSLGYDVYPTGARVNEAAQPISATKGWKGPRYDGWNHMINIATISSQRYIIDVGFGSLGPVRPVPLTADEISINVGPQTIRLTHGPIPDTTSSSSSPQPLWCYSHRHSDSSPWIPCYCFTETEFLPSDFVVMNHFTSTSRASWFMWMVVCVRMVVVGGEVVGDVTLFGDEVKRRVGGVSEVVARLGCEEERVRALEEFLGVRLTGAERAGIRGLVTELV